MSEQGSENTQVSDPRNWVDVGPCIGQDVLEETQLWVWDDELSVRILSVHPFPHL